MTRRDPGRGLDRRDFLRQGTAAVTAGSIGWKTTTTLASPPEPRVQRYVELGRTGLTVSDISFGSSRTADPAVVRRAFDRGINYFDTAESYRGGSSEEAIGEALHDVRDQIVITSKTKAGARDTRSELMSALEGSLRRLRTDHVDIYMNHAVNSLDRLRSSEWPEFIERAREQGKLRFSGMSGHGGHLATCLDHALEHDLVDVVLVAHNFGQDPAFYERFLKSFDLVAVQPELPPLLRKARERGVGVVAMKTLMGARLNDLRAHEHGGATFAQAAFRWVLSGEYADALVVSMTSAEMIDEYLGASGQTRNRQSDLRLLEHYARANGRTHCQHGCALCESSCPHGVPISEVLRTRMYDVDYGDPELARSDYAALGPAASACLGCADLSCLGACPNGIPIPSFTRDAARRLG